MADFQCLGHITDIKYLSDCVLVFVDEYKKGYRKSNGEIIDDKVFNWKCIFSGNENKRAYINKFFSRGMLVQIKGELFPYSIVNGMMVDGYSVFIQSINMAAYPRQSIRKEAKMIKESQENSSEIPNLKDFNSPDF